MKKLLLFFVVLSIGINNVNAQSKKAKAMLSEIEGKWSLDDNNNLTYVRVIESPNMTKDEIFNRALDYFIYNYGSGKSVIQDQDTEKGRIIAKGFYENLHIGVSLITTYINAWHIIRVDVKEGRARVIISMTNYDVKIVGDANTSNEFSIPIVSSFPLNKKGPQKTVYSKAFYNLYFKGLNSLDAIETSIKEGNTSKK